MNDNYLHCPLCGFEFQREDALCEHGCPLGNFCSLARCPSCEYEFPARYRKMSWFGRLFRKKRDPLPAGLSSVRRLTEITPGKPVQVMAAGDTRAERSTALAGFGLVPGAVVTVVQRRPECVIKVGETELALDRDIAGRIFVTDQSRRA